MPVLWALSLLSHGGAAMRTARLPRRICVESPHPSRGGALCRVIGPDAPVPIGHPLEGLGAPDFRVVEGLCRVVLAAKRAGSRLVLSEVSPELAALLDLAGLTSDLRWLVVEVARQSEMRKEPFLVQRSEEEVHPRDQAP